MISSFMRGDSSVVSMKMGGGTTLLSRDQEGDVYLSHSTGACINLSEVEDFSAISPLLARQGFMISAIKDSQKLLSTLQAMQGKASGGLLISEGDTTTANTATNKNKKRKK